MLTWFGYDSHPCFRSSLTQTQDEALLPSGLLTMELLLSVLLKIKISGHLFQDVRTFPLLSFFKIMVGIV